jgi:hypothetical protein
LAVFNLRQVWSASGASRAAAEVNQPHETTRLAKGRHQERIIHGVMESAELNRLILNLLYELKVYKSKCLSHNTALTAILNMDPETLATLTPFQVSELMDQPQREALALANEECAEVEQALASGNEFLPALGSFLRKGT